MLFFVWPMYYMNVFRVGSTMAFEYIRFTRHLLEKCVNPRAFSSRRDVSRWLCRVYVKYVERVERNLSYVSTFLGQSIVCSCFCCVELCRLFLLPNMTHGSCSPLTYIRGNVGKGD